MVTILINNYMQNNNTTTKFISRDQMQQILNNRPKGVDGKSLIDKFIQDGFQVEGIPTATSTVNTEDKSLSEKLKGRIEQITGGVKDYATGGKELIDNIKNGTNVDTKSDIKGGANILGGLAGGINDIFGSALDALGVSKLIESGVNALPDTTKQSLGNSIQYIENKYNSNLPEGTPQRAVFDAIGNLVTILPIGKGVQATKQGVEEVGKQVIKTASKQVAKVAEKGISDSLGLGLLKNVVNKVSNSDFGEKYIVKPLSGLDDSQMFQLTKTGQVIKNVDESLKYARQSLEDKSLPSLFTMAGNRFGNAIDRVVDLRKGLGAKMGSIEQNLANKAEILRFNSDNLINTISKYGLQLGKEGVESVNPLLKDVSGVDYNKVSAAVNAASKALDEGDVTTIRAIASHLKSVARDNFDEITKKYTDKTFQVINDIGKTLDQQVSNQIIENLPKNLATQYKSLMQNYAKYSQVIENAYSLIGREGVEGGRVKAGSVAKALSQSIHNQAENVRQIANFVKEKTGYDFFKDSNNADLLMQAVGDFRGQSLNRAINQVASNGLSTLDLVKKIVEFTGITDKSKNIESLIRKYNPSVVEKSVKKETAKSTAKEGAKVVFKEGGIYSIPEKEQLYKDVIKPQLDKIGKVKPDETIIYYSGDGKTGQFVNTKLDEVWGYPVEDLKVKKVKTADLVSTGDTEKDGVGYRILKSTTKKK